MSTTLLVYSYSAKNAGDLAITLGALDLLSKTDHNITTISRYSANDVQFIESEQYLRQRYSEVEILPSPFGLNRESSKIGLLRQYLSGFLKILGIKGNQEFKRKISGFDRVYFNGGNLLRCDSLTDLVRLVALTYPLKIAIKAHIPVVILPQSTVRVNYFGRKVLKSVLNASKGVYCREELSFRELQNHFPKAPLRLTTDMAFFIDHSIPEKRTKTNRIAITARSQTIGDLNDLPMEKQDEIRKQLTQICQKLIRRGCQVIFVVQTKKDLDFTNSIYSLFNEEHQKVDLVENYDPIELLKFYSTCDLLIGMRLHSIILALAVGTSCIGFFEESWGVKNQGVIEAYGQDYTYIGDSAENLFLKIEKQLSLDVSLQEKRIKDLIKHYQQEFTLY